MKFGLRIPSFKKKLAARVSVKRFVRHSVGLKAPRGLGWFTNPKKALYNRVYNRTTFSLGDVFQGAGHASHGSAMIASQGAAYAAGAQHSGGSSSSGCVTVFVVALIITAIVGTVGRHLGDQAALIALAVVSLAGSVVWVAARRTTRAAAEARRVEYENLASDVQRQAVVQSEHVAVQQQELEASAHRRAAKLLEEEAADAARREGFASLEEKSADEAARWAQVNATLGLVGQVVAPDGPTSRDRTSGVAAEPVEHGGALRIWRGARQEVVERELGAPARVDRETVERLGRVEVWKYRRGSNGRYALKVFLRDGVVVQWTGTL